MQAVQDRSEPACDRQLRRADGQLDRYVPDWAHEHHRRLWHVLYLPAKGVAPTGVAGSTRLLRCGRPLCGHSYVQLLNVVVGNLVRWWVGWLTTSSCHVVLVASAETVEQEVMCYSLASPLYLATFPSIALELPGMCVRCQCGCGSDCVLHYHA